MADTLNATIHDFSSQFPDREAVHAVDGSGLDAGNPPNHGTVATTMWLNTGDGTFGGGTDPDQPGQLGHITFSLGGIYEVSSMRVWNYNEVFGSNFTNRGIQNLTISTATSASGPYALVTNPATNTTTWTFARAPGSASYTGEVITFPAGVLAAYIRFDVQSNYDPEPDNNSYDFIGLSEVRIEGSLQPVIVLNTNDSGPGSLRQAIADAPPGGSIEFDLGSGAQVINLTSGELLINKNLTITGPGADLLTVMRNGAAPSFRIFNIASGRVVAISGLTIKNGNPATGGGGGILNQGTLTLTACSVSDNPLSSGVGGGIFSTSGTTLVVIGSTISNNVAQGGGAGIWIDASCTGHIINTTISGNTTGESGGGLVVFPSSTVVVRSSTITNNRCNTGNGGGPGAGITNFGTVTLHNTIVVGNFQGSPESPGNFPYPAQASSSYNLLGQGGAGSLTHGVNGNQIISDSAAMLGLLAANGGPTLTHAPEPGSPSVDQGLAGTDQNNDPIITDQRASPRPIRYDGTRPGAAGGDYSDIGAVELAVPACITPPANMVAWWPGDKNTTDIQGGNNMSFVNGGGFGSPQTGVGAFAFSGSDYATAGNPAAVQITGTEETIDGWINPSSTTDALYFGKSQSGANDFALYFLSGNVQAFVKLDGNEVIVNTGFVPPENVWTHLALTYDGSTIRIYANGVEVANQAATGNITESGSPFNIGGRDNTGGGTELGFVGRVDEVEVFTRALAQSEIAAIYNAGSGGKCKPCTPPPSEMVSWWWADGNAYDIQAANHGTWIGTETYAAGMVGQAFDFNGQASGSGANWVQADGSGTLNITGNQITLDGWIYPRSNAVALYFGKSANSNHPYLVQNNADGVHIFTFTSNGLVEYGTGYFPPLNTWTHIAMTYDGSAMRFYANGAEVFNGPQTGNLVDSSTLPFAIGNRATDPVTSFNGLMDEVEVFSRALSAGEVQALYAATRTGKCVPPPSVQFSSATYSTSEGDTNVTITVTRSGDPSGTAMVHYETSDGSATDGVDYEGTSGDLTFDPGIRTQSFTVTIDHEDGVYEGRETFTVTLSSPTGTNLGTPSAATVEIYDNDPPVVSNINDSGAGSLRQAIIDALPGHTITFDPVFFAPAGGSYTIALTSEGLAIDKDLTIAGPTDAGVILDGLDDVTVISIGNGTPNGPTVTLSYLTITRGSGFIGGGIASSNATLTVANCTLSNNSAFAGGGIVNGAGNGGTATLTVINCTLSQNSTDFGGGGILNFDDGGNAIANVTNCTLKDNNVDGGSGFGGGGIMNLQNSGSAVVNIGNTILDNSDGNVASNGTANDNGYNLISDVANPLLGPLQDNGGPTFTHAPQPGSPAIDQGKNLVLDINSTPVPFDQRGSTRPVRYRATIPPASGGDFSDIGAVELATPVCIPAPSGMISWWTGDGNTTDLQGNNDGTLQGATFAAGQVAQAFDFDGVDDYVQLPADPSLNPGTITFDAWIYMDATSGSRGVFWRGNHTLLLEIANGFAKFGSKDSAGNYSEFTGSTGIPEGQWTHVALTHDGTTRKIYINGVEDPPAFGDPTQAGLFTGNTDPVTLGTRFTADSQFFDGRIDEVEIFDHALTQAEIQAIYDAGAGGKCKPCFTPPADMVSWWPGDNHPNDILDGNHGTLAGGATYGTGLVGQGFALNGTSAHVHVPDSASVSLTGAISVDAWINPDDLTGTRGVITKYDSSLSATAPYVMWLENGILNFQVSDGSSGNYRYAIGTTTIPVGAFTHVAGTFDPATQEIRLYVNGVDELAPIGGGSSTVNSLVDNASPVRIGVYDTGQSSGFFAGVIDEVEIFNRALIADEIQAIYAADSAGKCKPPPNEAPVAGDDDLSDIDEDSGTRVIPFADLLANDTKPASEPSQTLTITAVSNAVGGTVQINGTNVEFSPTLNFNGAASFDYTVQDNGRTDGADDFKTDTGHVTFDITAVNDPPSFTKGADQIVNEDAGAQTVNGWATSISPGGGSDESGQTLTFTVSVIGTTGNLAFSSGPAIDSSGNLTYTTSANTNGTAMLSVTLSDNGSNVSPNSNTSGSQTFNITVNAVNDAPTFQLAGNPPTVNEDAGSQTISSFASNFQPGPVTATDESAQTLVSYTVTQTGGSLTFSSGPAIDNAGTLTYTATSNASGTATFDVRATDSGSGVSPNVNLSAAVSFTITVNGVNDAPTFTKGADQTVNEDAGAQTVNGWATSISAGPNESGQVLTFNVTGNTNTVLFSSQPAVSAAGTLTYTPAANANGSATITLTLSDNGGTGNGGQDTSAPQTFTITVNALNDAPSFTKGGDQTVQAGSGPQTVNNWATSISAGPADESGQTLTFLVSNDNNSIFSSQPAVSSDGTLTFTPANSASGTATVTVRLQDNGGTANGGQDTSAPQTFTITVSLAPTPTPTPTPSPTPNPTPTPSPSPSATPGASPTPSPTPSATPAQALNISTRLRVDVGDKVMIGGFIIRGNASKAVVLRGLGPSLANAGVPANTVLNDPSLALHGPNGALITSNDNWKDSPQRSQIEGTAFQPTDDREAVIVATLPPGNYTAIVSGVGQTTGVGLVEVYDNSQAADSDLANISTRGFVQTGNDVMIGGFTLGNNNQPTQIAVRALGPSLTSSGLSNVLGDPTLELHNANGTLMLSNDDWQSDPVSAGMLTANGLALPNASESGIFASLPPGQFTVILAGKNGGTGVGLIEIYNVK